MQLTGEEIIARNILTNVDLENAVQQQGIDLRLDRVFSFEENSVGLIPAKGKTTLPYRRKVDPEEEIFDLKPGYYEIVFKEGCNIPNDVVIANIKSRSSLVRIGAEIVCGQFDANFHTEAMGCFLRVNRRVWIERGARIGQVQVYETRPVSEEKLYNGQWQGDCQRNE